LWFLLFSHLPPKGLMLQGIGKIFKREHRDFEAFQIEISSYSSLECKICPRAVFAEEWLFANMSIESYQKIARNFPRVKWVIFQGWGDPLENENFPDMLRQAHEAGCLTAVATNGYYLTEELSIRLVEEEIESIIISLEEIPRVESGSLGMGSDLDLILTQIEKLILLRNSRKQKRPTVKLSFLMTRLNMSVLPQAISTAARLGVDEVVFRNLDYLPEERWNILRTFYHESPTATFQEIVAEMKRLGRQMKVSVQVYPLKAEEIPVCEANPPRNIFFSMDGSVCPCMYLRLPKKGEIPRIFLNKEYSVPQTFFGNINAEELSTIWNQETYISFRKVFEDRIRAQKNLGSVFDALSGRSSLPQENTEPPPPLAEVCRTCYKAYGI